MGKGIAIAKKLGLVTEVPSENYSHSSEEITQPQPKVMTGRDDGAMLNEQINTEMDSGSDEELVSKAASLISHLYEDNFDYEKGILKVEEVNRSLPDTLPLDVKRETVLQILRSFQLDPDSLYEDGESRRSALLQRFKEESTVTGESIDAHMKAAEELRERLDREYTAVETMRKYVNTLRSVVVKEANRIDSLLIFLDPERFKAEREGDKN